ncbi:bifunctional indole-3-glycerol-phosphate synthase TrpC/phosphoribosylanthranilate isomerase TrpF [uncultured Sphingomonas sp.]|uniref:bifunctional indole-3-glycerol-phosphate synthase TrpC/phosphoribosylanthranilate isomerase TrpF n=1 Tax=uncultured Sphingomonas sp. TaxID=158754 RepID=UPI0025F0B7FD|nr:bifunctional indole-3-glycerol-phosphate synthase TrpC/phosphoribosylanthranilate isomerase TrpF [uncultured Sphingomonas sp.]
MADVLSAIVERKRADVAQRLAGFDGAGAEPTRRSLREALARPGARFITEVKRASPSGHQARHTLKAAVRAYAPVADAISVLTDTPFFGGSLEDLRAVRAQFDGPVLAKDFIVDARQVAEARLHGADAVLCMLSVLDDAAARKVLAEAERLGMTALVEVHDEAELERALALGAAVIGINNRDLKTLKTDLAVTERLAARVPDDVLLVSESGIGSRADVERLAPLSDGFLVGSSLMAAEDIDEAARALVHGRVKLCGLTRADDVWAAALAGASHAGFVFVPDTPRAIEPRLARALAEAARKAGVKPVGVFRDAPAPYVIAAANDLDLAAVQLHGREQPETIDRIRAGFDGEVWTACAPGQDRGGDRPVFDNGPGGTGQAFDWAPLSQERRLPQAFLAGGIGPTNARDAQATGVYGIDVGSRVEAAPGRKDPVKVQALFDRLRPLDRRAA